MISRSGECILKDALFVSHVGNHGGVCIVNDNGMKLSSDSVSFADCTISKTCDLPYREGISAVAMGFFGKVFSLKSICIDNCWADKGFGTALYFSNSAVSSLELIQIYKCRGVEAIIGFECTESARFLKSNATDMSASLNTIGAYCRKAHQVSNVNFIYIHSEEFQFSWLEIGSGFDTSNFVHFTGSERSFVHINYAASLFDTCCFYDYPTSLPFYSTGNSGKATFSKCKADSFYQNNFPSGLSKYSSFETNKINGALKCTYNRKTCKNEIQNKMRLMISFGILNVTCFPTFEERSFEET